MENKNLELDETDDKDTEEHAPYLVVDYGEQLVADMEEARDELHKQVASVSTAVTLLWEVVRSFIVLIIPIIAGLGLTIVSRLCLPRAVASWGVTIFFSITIGFVFLNLAPLNEAINSYLNHRMYQAKFANCQCEHCAVRKANRKRRHGDGETTLDEGPIGKCEQTTNTENATGGADVTTEVVGKKETPILELEVD